MTEMNPNFLKTGHEVFGTRKVAGLYGIECEIEGRDLPAAGTNGWDIHQDGSLRGGYEYVTKGAVKFDDVKGHVKTLHTFIESSGGRFRPSHRASTHIHMNVGFEPFINVIGYITAFTIIEPVMLRMCGPERDGNLFCISTSDCGDLQYFMRQFIVMVRKGMWANMARGKYAALNIDPVFDKGSLEFRFFPSSLDENEIGNWVTWLNNLRVMVKSEKDKTFHAMFDRARLDPTAFVRTVMPDIDLNKFPVTTLEQALMMGCENAYEIIRVLEHELFRIQKTETVATASTKFHEANIGDILGINAPAAPQMIRRVRR